MYDSATGNLIIPTLCGIGAGINKDSKTPKVTPAGLPSHTHDVQCGNTSPSIQHSHTFKGSAAHGYFSIETTGVDVDKTIFSVGKAVKSKNAAPGGDTDHLINWNYTPSGTITAPTAYNTSHNHITIAQGGGIGNSTTVQPQTYDELVYIVVKI